MAKNQASDNGYKNAPAPGGNYVKIAVGMTVNGVMKRAEMEIEKRKNKKGKETEKERYHFSLELTKAVKLLVGKKNHEAEKEFAAGDVVTLPDHGYLTSVMRRTACEIAGTSFDDKEDTDLKPLVGMDFEITRLPDGKISSGEFVGVASALYDVKYREAVVA